MKKSVLLAAFAMFLSLISYKANAQSGLGFEVGLSTPNDQINNVYNSDNFNLGKENFFGNLWREGSKPGWHLGVRLRLPVAENFAFQGGIAWNRFPQTRIEVRDPNNQSNILAVLNTTQNIIPISAGINYYIFRSVISPYVVGELSYNYISNSVDIENQNTSIITTNPFGDTSYNRIGFGAGAGVDLDLKIINLNLTGKYNMANLIGQESGEQAKTYITLTLGVFFGGLMPL